MGRTGKEASSLYSAMFTGNRVMMLLLDPVARTVVDANDAAVAFYGYSAEAFKAMRRSDLVVDDQGTPPISFDRIMADREGLVFTRHRLADGSIREMGALLSVIDIEGRKLIQVILRDYTEQKELERKLKLVLSEKAILLDNAPLGIAKTVDRRIVWMNSFAEATLGYSLEELLDRSTRILYASDESYDSIGSLIASAAAWGGTIETVRELVKKDGRHITVRYKGAAVDPSDFSKGIIWILEDIGERLMAEEKIKSLLADKELLLREVHHRIKNDLLIVSSLLALRRKFSENPETRKTLCDSIAQIEGMGLLYEKLYRSSDFGSASFKEYLASLVHEITDLFGKSKPLRTRISLDDHLVPVTILTSIAIILTELITNSMKHAFNGVENPTITLYGAMVQDTILLCYEDNGCGLPSDFSFDSSNSLGGTLIKGYVAQLDGSIRAVKAKGARFMMEIPLPTGEPGVERRGSGQGGVG